MTVTSLCRGLRELGTGVEGEARRAAELSWPDTSLPRGWLKRPAQDSRAPATLAARGPVSLSCLCRPEVCAEDPLPSWPGVSTRAGRGAC